MENYIKIIYKKFLYGTIRKEEFMEMRHDLNLANKSDINNLLEEEWNEDMNSEVMAEKDKEAIRSKLNFYVEYDQKSLFPKKLIYYAAIVIPIFVIAGLLSVLVLQQTESKNFVVSVARGNKAVLTLPDASKVWVNSNSKLEYVVGNKDLREIKLNGEAFFKVSRNTARPFVITFSNYKIEVLGTSFNVKALENSDIIETSLVEGSVKISGAQLSQDYYLKPSEKAIFDRRLNQIKIIHTTNELETAWKDNVLKFDTERFSEVMNRLEDWYDITIVIKYPQIENDLITGSFRSEGIESVLDILKTQYNINYIRNGNTITILPLKTNN